MADPTWAPELTDVAAYITSRTLDNALPGDATPTGSFSEDTYPTSAQVNGLITGACVWVTLTAGTIDATLVEAAKQCAALRTAALVELSFPTRDADVENAEQLLAQADAMRADLAAANVAVTGANLHTAPLVPQWSMPDPAWWGDLNHLGS
jgi:hypothetical protein